MRHINEIVIHCTATRPDWWAGQSTAAKIDEVRHWHTDPVPKGRGWSDIGYHYLIDRDGTVMAGRPVERIGAHVAGHNSNTIGVAMFGGFGGAATDKIEDHFTPAQIAALRRTIEAIKREHPIKQISGHNQYANKACPCFYVPAWYATSPRPEPKTAPQRPDIPETPQRPSGGLISALLAFIMKIFGK